MDGVPLPATLDAPAAQIDSALERATNASGDHEAVLRFLLEAWRVGHAPSIAALIQQVSVVVTAAQPAITGRTVGAREAAWKNLAASGDALVLGRLLRAPWPKRDQDIEARLRALAEWPEDPRIGDKVLAEFDDVTPRLFKSALRLVARVDDWSRIEPLRETIARRWVSAAFADETMATVRAHWDARRIRVLPLHDEAKTVLARIQRTYDARAAHTSEAVAVAEDLFATIYENPQDDGARLVLADVLQQHGDPRGELIALQHQAPSAKVEARIRKLLKKHGQTWLGPMHRDLRNDGWSFERGFPVCAVVDWPSPDRIRRITGHAEWATYEHVVFHKSTSESACDEIVAFAQNPSMRSLRGLHGLTAPVFRALASAGVSLEAADLQDDPTGLPAMKGLQTLGYLSYARLEPLIASELWHQLEHFIISGRYDEETLKRIDAHGEHLESLTILPKIPKQLHLPDDSRLVLRRGRDGRLSALTVDWCGSPRARHVHRRLPDSLRWLIERVKLTAFSVEAWPGMDKARQAQIEIDWVVDKNLPRDTLVTLPWRQDA